MFSLGTVDEMLLFAAAGGGPPPLPPDPPVYLGSSSFSATSGTASHTTFTLPAHNTGDRFIAHVSVNATGKTFSVGGGWTIGDTDAGGSACWAWRVADGTESEPTFSWSGSAGAVSRVHVFRDANGSATPPLIGAKSKANGSGTTLSIAGLTSTAQASSIVALTMVQNNQTIPAAGGSYEDMTTNANGVGSVRTAYQYPVDNGVTSDAISVTITSAAWEAFLIELQVP